MGLKRPCGSAASIGNQHRGLHFHKALSAQIFADGSQYPGTLDEGILHLCVHDQVHVALAVTHIRICQAMELLRKHLKALGKKGHLCGMNGYLACLGGKGSSLHTHDIADVHFLEILIRLLTHAVPCHINLDAAF